MGKKSKTKLPFFFRNADSKSPSSSSWPWPSCHQPKTLSFRANSDIFKTINSAYLDSAIDNELESPESNFFTNSSESPSFSSLTEDQSGRTDPIETMIRELRSERLFFEPEKTSSILEAKAAAAAASLPFKDSVILSMESRDPHVDFRKSMEEMVEAHGVKNWESLEELLCWYLRVNGKCNHGYILGAFIDLLVSLAFAGSCSSSPSSSSSSRSPSSPMSFYNNTSSSNSMSTSSFSTACVSCLEAELEVETPASSCLLLEEIKEEIRHEDEASSSSNV